MEKEIIEINGKFYKEFSIIKIKEEIYIISDEEIKDGDWYAYWTIMADEKDREYKIAQCIDGILPKCPRAKIIATTDKSLKKYCNTCKGTRVCATGDCPICEYDNHEIPRPSNEFIQAYCKSGGIDKVLVEYIDNGYEVDMEGVGGMDEGDTCWMSKIELKVAEDNTITIKPIAKSQSELWDDAFRVIWNRDVSEGTREAMIREKYKISLK